MLSVKINNLKISYNNKPVLIAEIGINHQGSLNTAKLMARLAVENGVDIVKHQTHFIEDEMSLEAQNIKVFKDQSIYSVIKECSLKKEEEIELKHFVKEEGYLGLLNELRVNTIHLVQHIAQPLSHQLLEWQWLKNYQTIITM